MELAAPRSPSAVLSSSRVSTRVVSRAPAPVRGLRTSGKPTASANAYTSSAVSAAVLAAVGTPASRRACFIDGLSRHSQAVRTLVPGMSQASRACATGSVWASIVVSSRSTHSRDWTQRTASVITQASVTLETW